MKRTLVAGCLLAWLSFAACSRPGTEEQVEMPKVRVGFSPLLSFGPIMIADAEGFFRDEGLDVELVPSLSSQDETVGLVTGDLDVKLGPLHAIFFSAIARGANIRVVASQGYLARDGCTYFGIVRRHGADSSASSIRRIRSSQDGVTRFVADRMLEAKGVDISTLETMRLPEALHAMSLENGSIDALAASEPSLTRLKDVGFVWLSAQKAAPDLQWGVVAFSERLLERERETGERFLRAYARAITQYRQGKTPRNVSILAKATGETEEIIREACWLPFRADLSVDWNSLSAFQEWARSEGFMEQTLSPNQTLDTTFIAAKQLLPGNSAP